MESVVLAIQTIKYGWVFDGGDDDCHLNVAVVYYPGDHGRILCEKMDKNGIWMFEQIEINKRTVDSP